MSDVVWTAAYMPYYGNPWVVGVFATAEDAKAAIEAERARLNVKKPLVWHPDGEGGWSCDPFYEVDDWTITDLGPGPLDA